MQTRDTEDSVDTGSQSYVTGVFVSFASTVLWVSPVVSEEAREGILDSGMPLASQADERKDLKIKACVGGLLGLACRNSVKISWNMCLRPPLRNKTQHSRNKQLPYAID